MVLVENYWENILCVQGVRGYVNVTLNSAL